MTIDQVRTIVAHIIFRNEWFEVTEKGDGFLLQLQYEEPDVDTGEVEIQRARKWYLSSHATESEVVRTAFAACMMSAEHRVREHFLYACKRIFGPHISVEALSELSTDAWVEKRKEPVRQCLP